MSGFFVSPVGLTMLFAFVAFIAVFASCVLGVIDFRWKKPSPPPTARKLGADEDLEAVRAFLRSRIGDDFTVHFDDGSFYVATSPDCALPDSTLQAALTQAFPRFIFGMRRIAHAPTT